MNEQREVVFLSGVRTAIGDYGGSLKDIPPSELAARVVREAVSRALRIFRERGWISTERRRITVLALDALRERGT